jgi:hypothetical protein
MVILLQDRWVNAVEVWVCTKREDGSSYTNLNPPNENGEPLLLLRNQRLVIDILKDGTLLVERMTYEP